MASSSRGFVGTGVTAVAALTLLALVPGATPGATASLPPAPPAHVLLSGSWTGAGSSVTASFRHLPIGTGWGPTATEIGTARRLVGGLTLRQRAGQVVVASYSGTAPPTRLVNRLHLGGVVLFADNITGTAQVRRSNLALQRSAARAGRGWPVFVAVDQEGGLVSRLGPPATVFPAFMSAGAARNRALTRAAAYASGAELAGLGFTVDLAPDADVTAGPSDPTIGSRSAGSFPRLVAGQATAAMRGYRATGVVPFLKHFPGHGSVDANSHLTLPVQTKTVAQLDADDLVPFRAGITAGAPAIMVAHLDVSALDPGVPSSLSRAVVTGLLRNRLGFQGLASTDSLQMKAVTDQFGSAASAVQALRAGEDVVLMPPSPRAAIDGIVAAVRAGHLSQARLDQAATRQVALLLHQRHRGLVRRAPGTGRTASARLSSAALTSVTGACSGRIVGPRVHVTGPSGAVATFRAEARAAGLHTARRGTTVRLLGWQTSPQRGDVVVALDTPYVLGQVRARLAKVATYGETAGAMHALVEFLLGRAPAPGHLPVRVARVSRTGC